MDRSREKIVHIGIKRARSLRNLLTAAVEVLKAELERVDPQLARYHLVVGFVAPSGLRPANPAKCARWDFVRIIRTRNDTHMRKPVRSPRKRRRPHCASSRSAV